MGGGAQSDESLGNPRWLKVPFYLFPISVLLSPFRCDIYFSILILIYIVLVCLM